MTNYKRSASSSVRPITNKLGNWGLRVNDSLLLIHILFSRGHVRSHGKLKNNFTPLLQNVWPASIQGSRFRVRGIRLPSHITTWLQDDPLHLKNSDKDSPRL